MKVGVGFLFALVMLLSSAEAQSTQVRPPATRTVWDGVFFHAQADRGEVNFSRYCVRCHDGSSDALILSSEEFFNRWREERLTALYNYIKTNMPADNPGSLSEREYLDTLTYILQLNFYPAGETDLLPPQLDRVQIVGAEGPKPLQEGSLVYAVGCLSQTENGWKLTAATGISRSRNLLESERAFKTLETQPLGSDNVRLEGSFDAVGKQGAKVYAKGSLTYRGSDSGIDVAAIRVLSPQCNEHGSRHAR
jgi:hypothetical protein